MAVIDKDELYRISKLISDVLDGTSVYHPSGRENKTYEALGAGLYVASEYARLLERINTPCTYDGQDFEWMHYNGARTWGVRWLSMNFALRDAMDEIGVDFARPDNAMICTTLATAALQAVSNWTVETDEHGKIIFTVPQE